MGTRRRVVLGVTGSIAAYKAAELIRLLTKAGVEVHVILTRSGAEFITPLSLGTLSGQPVTTGMFDDPSGRSYLEWGQGGVDPSRTDSVAEVLPRLPGEPAAGAFDLAGAPGISANSLGAAGTGAAHDSVRSGIAHIQASRESDLIVVAPASGNILGKVAHGIADDSLSTAIMASSAPVLFAPAMNTRMWDNPAVQENVRLLKERGYRFVHPGSGDLACGEIGTGRMAEPREIAGEVLRLLFEAPDAPGVLVSAGRTEEPIDPVRYLSNRSSGKMGFAVAEAARDLGFRVLLIAGPASVDPPAGVAFVRVRTAEEMAREIEAHEGAHEILVMAAAVADYRPAAPAEDKIPSGQDDLSLALAPNPDILATVSPRRRAEGRVTVGFALETSGEIERARRKLASKGCDLLVMNNPLKPGSEFGGDTNEVVLLHADGRQDPFPPASKSAVAAEILRAAAAILRTTRGEAGDDAPGGVRRGGQSGGPSGGPSGGSGDEKRDGSEGAGAVGPQSRAPGSGADDPPSSSRGGVPGGEAARRARGAADAGSPHGPAEGESK